MTKKYILAAMQEFSMRSTKKWDLSCGILRWANILRKKEYFRRPSSMRVSSTLAPMMATYMRSIQKVGTNYGDMIALIGWARRLPYRRISDCCLSDLSLAYSANEGGSPHSTSLPAKKYG